MVSDRGNYVVFTLQQPYDSGGNDSDAWFWYMILNLTLAYGTFKATLEEFVPSSAPEATFRGRIRYELKNA